MGRKPCPREDLNRGAWTAEEDRILKAYIKDHGEGRWRSLSKKAGLRRCEKSCRLRWMNYLRPDIKRGNITHEEEDLIIRLHKLLGNKWSLIAGRLPGRTDNEIKNYWNTYLRKKVQGQHQLKRCQPPTNETPLLVRTKAIRCAKLFITPQQHIAQNQEGNVVIKPVMIGKLATESRHRSPNPSNTHLGLLRKTFGGMCWWGWIRAIYHHQKLQILISCTYVGVNHHATTILEERTLRGCLKRGVIQHYQILNWSSNHWPIFLIVKRDGLEELFRMKTKQSCASREAGSIA